MAEYTFRRGKPWKDAPETYEVAKFDGNIKPTTVYHVWRAEDGSLRCDCPAGIHHGTRCKHVKWIGEWLGMDPTRVYVVDDKSHWAEAFAGQGIDPERLFAAVDRWIEGKVEDVA
jgi:hypothetical protein